ncbi:hypothetical protein BKA66DRAFT_441588 [Pyrenochaeta sp. MPI-SDFR-AT-0127]|nr:hypothetical protein BKA66DRAFT_441588 [Pyrenochaeta sp. MPI-SDFR-AT-0127]
MQLARVVRSSERPTATGTRPAYGDLKVVGDWLPDGRMEDLKAKTLITEEQTKVRNTQTSNAFEASAARTAGQGSGALDGLRRKMRRQLHRLWLAMHASGEHLQITALLGGSESPRDRASAIESWLPVNPLRTVFQQHRFHQSFIRYSINHVQLPICNEPGTNSRVHY